MTEPNIYITSTENISVAAEPIGWPKPIWRWYVFGKGQGKGYELCHLMHVDTAQRVSLWRRIITHIFLGSVWERLP